MKTVLRPGLLPRRYLPQPGVSDDVGLAVAMLGLRLGLDDSAPPRHWMLWQQR